jgi:PPK2 family polyphosphate:nucleotide phosphotransferase
MPDGTRNGERSDGASAAAPLLDPDRFRIAPDAKVRLDRIDPADTAGITQDDALARSEVLRGRLEELQGRLYADGSKKVLVVLQAIDAGGKDGTIRTVFQGVNPQGVTVTSFKRPTDEELAHDFLWRVHQHTPGNGMLAIFNRSHYEDVLVARVHGLVPPAQWKKRYGHIRAFEELLIDEGTTIVKFFLHISREEQRVRQQQRIDDPRKRWKFEAADLEERKHWDAYAEAFEAMLERTSTDRSPWYVVPADRKWFRNLAVGEVLVATLTGLDLRWPQPDTPIDAIVVT